jgi:hypothetical protein
MIGEYVEENMNSGKNLKKTTDPKKYLEL